MSVAPEQILEHPSDHEDHDSVKDRGKEVPSASYSAFFYGTLMHPKILQRVINYDGHHLEIAPAILPEYVRHHVQGASFPAIIPYEQSYRFFKTDIFEEQRCVKGVIVHGLSAEDMKKLHYFEGNMYKHITVHAHPVGQFLSMQEALEQAFVNQLEALQVATTSERLPALEVKTYIWDLPIKDLSPEIWSFRSFVRDKLDIWL